jgi:hypothetical protein
MAGEVVTIGRWTLEVGTLAQWAAAAGTASAVVWAIYSQALRERWRRPKLELEDVQPSPQDCVVAPFQDGTPTIHIRFRVRNVGQSPARSVQVFANDVTRLEADGTWQREATFPPMNLTWADLRRGTRDVPLDPRR